MAFVVLEGDVKAPDLRLAAAERRNEVPGSL